VKDLILRSHQPRRTGRRSCEPIIGARRETVPYFSTEAVHRSCCIDIAGWPRSWSRSLIRCGLAGLEGAQQLDLGLIPSRKWRSRERFLGRSRSRTVRSPNYKV